MSRRSQVKRVGIVFPFDTLDSRPNICDAASFIADHGFLVDIFAYANASLYTFPRFADPKIRIHLLRHKRGTNPNLGLLEGTRKVQNVGSASRQTLASISRAIYRIFDRLPLSLKDLVKSARVLVEIPFIWLRHWKANYICFIGIDPEGLDIAAKFAGPISVPIAYYSLELLLSYELVSKAERALKEKERKLSRRARFVVVQDRERARLLTQDNGLEGRVILIPNGRLGPARREKKDFWHEGLKLPAEARVVLHPGLGEWQGLRGMVESARYWPEPWVLVIHSRQTSAHRRLLAELKEVADPARVFFSLEPVPRDEFPTLVDSADAGIAFYAPMERHSRYAQGNIETIGLSSGKIANFLQAGLPVIVNRNESLSNLIGDPGWATIVTDASDIGPALEQISSQYEHMSKCAIEAYQALFSPECGYRELVERLDSLRSSEKTVGIAEAARRSEGV